MGNGWEDDVRGWALSRVMGSGIGWGDGVRGDEIGHWLGTWCQGTDTGWEWALATPTAIMVLGIKREVGALPPDIHALPAGLLGCDSGQAETSILQPAALGTAVQLVH